MLILQHTVNRSARLAGMPTVHAEESVSSRTTLTWRISVPIAWKRFKRSPDWFYLLVFIRGRFSYGVFTLIIS